MLELQRNLGTRPKKEKNKDIRKEIISLLNKKEQAWFEICQLAYEVYSSKLYENWSNSEGGKYTRVSDYASEELGLSYRTFMWYVQMGKYIKELGINKETIGDSNWTKFKEICSILKYAKKEDMPFLIGIVKEKSFREIQEIVTDYKLKKQNKEKIYKISFKLLEEQYKVYKEAIDLAKKNFKVEDEAMAIEAIMTFYLINHDKIIGVDYVESSMEERLR